MRSLALAAALAVNLGAQQVIVHPAHWVMAATDRGPVAFTATLKGLDDQAVVWNLPVPTQWQRVKHTRALWPSHPARRFGDNGFTPVGVHAELNPGTGTFQLLDSVPQGACQVIRVRATSARRPEVWGEALVYVVRGSLAERLGLARLQALAREKDDTFLKLLVQGRPFRDPETGQAAPGVRFTSLAEGGLRPDPRLPMPAPGNLLDLAWGLPNYVSLMGVAFPGQSMLQSEGVPGGPWRSRLLAVRGEQYAEVNVRRGAPRILEIQSSAEEGAAGAATRRHRARIRLTGVLPFQDLGDDPGPRPDLRHPVGLALAWENGQDAWRAVVSDDQAQVLLSATSEGRILPFAGTPGVAGHLDGPVGHALFKEPTFLASRFPPGGDAEIFVADTGNHVIRRIKGGLVETWAGSGAEGAADAGSALAASFNRPTGIAFDPAGNLFVADSGNLSIRRIDAIPPHPVTTVLRLAPDRDAQGHPPPRLAGLRCVPSGELEFVVGHAVFSFSPSNRTLFGLAGDPLEAGSTGFRVDLKPGSASKKDSPSLDGPWDICRMPLGLLICDEGNHALRLMRVEGGPDATTVGLLATLVGDPTLPTTRMGAARPGGLLPEGDLRRFMGALGAPRAILPLPSPKDERRFLVAEGASLCLVNLPFGFGEKTLPRFLGELGKAHQEHRPLEVPLGRAVQLRFLPAPIGPGAQGGVYHWSLEWLDEAGRTFDYASGVNFQGASLDQTFCPDREGTYLLRLSALSASGHSYGSTFATLNVVPAGPEPVEAPKAAAPATEEVPAPRTSPPPEGAKPPAKLSPTRRAAEAEATAPVDTNEGKEWKEGKEAKEGKEEKRETGPGRRSRRPKDPEGAATGSSSEPEVEAPEAMTAMMEAVGKGAPVPSGPQGGGFENAVVPKGRLLLLRRGFKLLEDNLDHIRQRHLLHAAPEADGLPPSRFLEEFAPVEAFRRLLAEGLAHATEEGKADAPDRASFRCRSTRIVGRTGMPSIPTHTFRVVAARERDDEVWRIITAFPEPDADREEP